MKRFSRRDFVRLFTAAAASAFTKPKRAFAEESSDNLVAFSPSIALEIAAMFAESSLESGLVAQNPIPLLDLDGNQIGWSVDYVKNGNPHGYILLDTTVEGLVSRFSQYEGTTNLFESSLGDDGASTCSIGDTPKLVAISPLDFGALDENSGVLFSRTTDEIIMNNSSRSVSGTKWKDLMIDYSKIVRSPYTITSEDYIGDFWFLTESQIEKHTGKYACAVTALFAIAGLTQNGNGFLIDTTSEYNVDWNAYNQIWEKTSTSTDRVSNGVTYGKTRFTQMGPGFSAYCSEVHGYTQFNSYKWSPTINDFKNQVSKRKHSLFSAEATFTNGNSSGHTMAVIGWGAVTGGGINTTGLFVFDGWSSVEFLKPSFSEYNSYHATFF